MRLIDADRLKEVVNKNFYGEAGAGVMCQIIDEQPTAFDKNKVITTLKDQYEYSRRVRNKNSNIYFEYWDGRTDSYDDVISIVEKGGADG